MFQPLAGSITMFPGSFLLPETRANINGPKARRVGEQDTNSYHQPDRYVDSIRLTEFVSAGPSQT